jgi:hypothetical protein
MGTNRSPIGRVRSGVSGVAFLEAINDCLPVLHHPTDDQRFNRDFQEISNGFVEELEHARLYPFAYVHKRRPGRTGQSVSTKTGVNGSSRRLVSTTSGTGDDEWNRRGRRSWNLTSEAGRSYLP